MEFEQQAVYQKLLNQIYNQEILKNTKEIEVWSQYKTKHEKIIEGLQTISSELSLNCVVPVGKKALMKGKIIHTNEILVCIGDGYFVKYSSQQAIALCKRRIKKSDEMLKKLEKERNLLELNQILPSNFGAFGSGECKDLLEHCSEQELNDWKAEHRKKEKEYRQKLLKTKQEKNESSDKNDEKSADDIFEMLDQLELEEELNDELNRSEGEEKSGLYSEEKILFNDLNVESTENSNKTEVEKEINIEEDKQSVEEKINICTDPILNEEKTDTNVTSVKCDNNCDTPAVDIKKETSIPQFSHTKKHRKRKNAEKSRKDTRINGKFEVSIIKEEDLEKTLQRPNFLLNSSASLPAEASYNHKKRKSLGRRVSFAEPDSDTDKKNFFDADRQYNQDDPSSNSYDFQNEDVDDVIKIDFTHSETETTIVEGTGNEILSPKDIYKVFCKPKSILKKTPGSMNINYNCLNISTIDENDEAEISESFEESSFNEDEPRSAYNFVVQDIQEKKVDERGSVVADSIKPEVIIQDIQEKKPDEMIQNNIEPQRPMSRFKMERANLKK